MHFTLVTRERKFEVFFVKYLPYMIYMRVTFNSNSQIGSGFDPDYEVIKNFLIIEQDVKNMQFSVCSTSQNRLNAHLSKLVPSPAYCRRRPFLC